MFDDTLRKYLSIDFISVNGVINVNRVCVVYRKALYSANPNKNNVAFTHIAMFCFDIFSQNICNF